MIDATSKPDAPAPHPIPDNAVIRIAGLGGVGQPLAHVLARFLAASARPATLLLIDGDRFEPHNASRMSFASCGNKAEVLRNSLLDHHRDSALTIRAIPEFLRPDNIARLLPSGEHSFLLAVDNHATRKLVSDHAATLADACIISGGNDGVGPDSAGIHRRGTAGNVQVYIRRAGADISPSLTRFHPEIRSPADRRPDELGCADLVASSPQILFTNLQTAAAMAAAWWLHSAARLVYSELRFDIALGRMGPLALAPAS